jgi:DNA-binding transcriptional LysR family regulator
MKDLNSLQIFLMVVEKASFTAASKRLGIPKATVSYKVSELEKDLGVRLLNRSTRAVTTTPDGAALAERCGPLLQDILEAGDWISQAGKTPKGLLRVKAPTTYTQWAIAPALPKFLKQYPKIEIAMTISDDFSTDIIQQGIDLVVAVGSNADSSLVRFRLGNSMRRLYASRDYVESHGKLSTPEDLKSHRCLICSQPGHSYSWTLKSKSNTKKIAVSGPMVSTDYSPIIEAARQGLGVALLPDRICEADVNQGILTPVLVDWYSDQPEFNALVPSKKLLTPKVKAFIEFLKANPW